jgi:exopolysaccharide production protein ExoZ
MLRSIQAMRGVAALLVFLLHLFLLRRDGAIGWIGPTWYLVGPAGVDIFFVISGLVVTSTAVRAATSGPFGAVPFALHRVFRIYPLYWVVLSFAIPASAVLTLAPPMPDPAPLRLALALTPQNPKILLAWTLFYEMFFYAVLTVLIALAPRRLLRAIAGWIAIEAVLITLGLTIAPALRRWVFASPLILEFAAGAAVAYLVSRDWLGWGWTTLALGLGGFALGIVLHAAHPLWEAQWRTLYFGLPSAFIIYGLVVNELRHGRTLPRWLQRTGDASYSIYLWHQLLLTALLFAGERIGLVGRVPDPVILIVFAAIALAWGFASYRLIERPARHRLRGLAGAWPREPSLPPAVAGVATGSTP